MWFLVGTVFGVVDKNSLSIFGALVIELIQTLSCHGFEAKIV